MTEIKRQMVTCLMVATESSFQIWYSSFDGQRMDCLFCKVLLEVSQLDFVNLPDLGSIDQEITFVGVEEFGEDRQILAQLAPLIAYVTFEDKTQLVFYSLVKE